MLIRAYGLFWRREEIDWNPGRGRRNAFRLLGRRGTNLPGLELADFRQQQGIYILYGDLGAHYVGLVRRQGLGKRLKDHTTDEHRSEWDRFSWFGFRNVLRRRDHYGHQLMRGMATNWVGNPNHMIADVEALLIKAMALRNKAQMNFRSATRWEQVKEYEVEAYAKKIGRR